MKKTAWFKRRHKKPDHASDCPYEIETPPAPKFPPETVHVNLDTFLERNSHCCVALHYHRRAWFEDANYIYHPDFGEDGTQLTLAQSKQVYHIERRGTPDYYFDMEEAAFDSRFAFPELPRGQLRFGKFHDNQLGRIFFLTEPKNAADMLFKVGESVKIIPWTDHSNEPLFTRLFQEKLHHAIDSRFTESEYIRPSASETKSKTDAVTREAHNHLEDRISSVAGIIKDSLKTSLAEFDVELDLRLDTEFFHNAYQEWIVLTVSHHKKWIIHRHLIDVHDSAATSEADLAKALTSDVEKFFDRYRTKFYAFKKLYDANLSYHDLVNPSSSPPEFDYGYIFRNY